MIPRPGRIVHYVSYGTPGGEYTRECRAAIITEVEDDDVVGLCVLNPSGLFFNRTVEHGEYSDRDAGYPGGTWHWPELTP